MAVLSIEHIESDPNIMRGSPRIAGARVRVQDVWLRYRDGDRAQEIAEEFEITVAQVFAALSYYYDHRADIEADMQRQIERAEQWLKEGKFKTTDDLKARIRAQDPNHPLLREDSPE